MCVNSCPRELCVNRPTKNSTKFERMTSDQFWKIAYRNTITFLWIWETFCFQNDDRNFFFKFRNLFFKFRFSIRSFVYGIVWFPKRSSPKFQRVLAKTRPIPSNIFSYKFDFCLKIEKKHFDTSNNLCFELVTLNNTLLSIIK